MAISRVGFPGRDPGEVERRCTTPWKVASGFRQGASLWSAFRPSERRPEECCLVATPPVPRRLSVQGVPPRQLGARRSGPSGGEIVHHRCCSVASSFPPIERPPVSGGLHSPAAHGWSVSGWIVPDRPSQQH